MSVSALLDAFDQQVAWCQAPAPFTARVLQRSRDWLARDGHAAATFAALAADPLAGAVALRWAAALHHLALRGLSPWAGLWPPAVGASDAALDSAITTAWAEQRAHCDAALELPPQTNEVQRSAALLPGLLHVAARTELPIMLLEIGASAGLNLWCDRYRYEARAWSWGGPQQATPVLRCQWTGPSPPVGAPLEIAGRAGCDAHPIDLTQPGQALRLASFIWPDQPERLARLRSACGAAQGWLAAEDLVVEALPAAQFVARELLSPNTGCATVLMHSVVWQYIADDEQRLIRQTIEDAGRRASREAPLAWLRFEPPRPDVKMELRCRIWPGGDDQLLARCHPHGAAVEWLG